eukprot:Gregarina_sp_Poly_1__2130@NODE_1564_length_3841_cov_141_446741_g1031_i0_p2_GENE_NODE_1564_length_3841_cov_141_446741_g1031_i0NODE_1564_length_3841_cov_141_446741_g1031_i0_p2_ORF_typecomplete_len310_score54_99BCIP/PF13862_6/3_3e20_NODE_1564_length_3841_cov_141_446741_g1031_i04471376
MGRRKKCEEVGAVSKYETVNVEFEILEPSELYESGIRTQLARLCKLFGGDVFDVAKAIIDQVNVGCVISILDEPIENTAPNGDRIKAVENCKHSPQSTTPAYTVLGVCSILSLNQYYDALKPMIANLDKILRNQGQKCLNEKSVRKGEVGFLFAEGISNIPPSLLLLCFTALLEDIEWTKKQDDCPADELANWTALKTLITFSTCYISADVAVPTKKRKTATEAETVALNTVIDQNITFKYAEVGSALRDYSTFVTYIPVANRQPEAKPSVESPANEDAAVNEFVMISIAKFSSFRKLVRTMQTEAPVS